MNRRIFTEEQIETLLKNRPFGHLKDEVDYKTCKTFDELKTVIGNYMGYYNQERHQWNLKKMTPVEYRNHLLEKAA